jgi:hypothetical protein
MDWLRTGSGPQAANENLPRDPTQPVAPPLPIDAGQFLRLGSMIGPGPMGRRANDPYPTRGSIQSRREMQGKPGDPLEASYGRDSMLAIRERNLKRFSAEHGAHGPLHEMPNRHLMARIGDPWSMAKRFGTDWALLSPQGSPILYGNSPYDLVRRGFPTEEQPPLARWLQDQLLMKKPPPPSTTVLDHPERPGYQVHITPMVGTQTPMGFHEPGNMEIWKDNQKIHTLGPNDFLDDAWNWIERHAKEGEEDGPSK